MQDLHKLVQEGLRKHKGNLLHVAQQTGNSFCWIQNVARGTYKSQPSYARLVRTLEWLRANKP